jgi:hypothetical protein|tara:strand:+ start:208 stop:630 length:423 start_codon:yes stop_codon:yes gene_type:complete
MFEDIQLSKFFWFSMSIAYAFCFSALYTYATIPEYVLELNNTAQINITMKLATVRLVIVAIALLTYPIILFRFFKYAKYFTVALTAWAVTVYIDDYFVLSEIIQYPESQLFSLVQSLRPIMIAGLFWMSIELVFRPLSLD